MFYIIAFRLWTVHHRRLLFKRKGWCKEKVHVYQMMYIFWEMLFSEAFPGYFLSERLIWVSNSDKKMFSSVQPNWCFGLKKHYLLFLFLFAFVPDVLPYYYYIYSSPQMEYQYCKLFNMTCVKVILQAVSELLPFILTGTNL